MTNLETIENNKLIAEFMGCGSQLHLVEHPETGEYVDAEYHSSWDWLMPVVEKIDSIGFDIQIGRISVNISRILDRENPIVSLVCGNVSNKKELLWSSVVEFIKWYNHQNLKP